MNTLSSSSTPDTIILQFKTKTGNGTLHVGTTFWIDDVSLAYNSEGTFENMPVRTQVSLYPNPSSETLFLSGNESFSGCNVDVFDINGKLVLTSVNSNNSLDISQLIKGNYFLKLTDKSGRVREGRFEVVW